MYGKLVLKVCVINCSAYVLCQTGGVGREGQWFGIRGQGHI